MLPHREPARRSAVRLAALPGIAAVGLGASLASLPVLCPFRLCTGHACPGCGLTRSIGALVRGNIEMSWRYHPVAIVLLAQIAVASLVLARRPELTVAAFAGRHSRWMLANVALLLVVWALRWRLGMLGDVVDSP